MKRPGNKGAAHGRSRQYSQRPLCERRRSIPGVHLGVEQREKNRVSRAMNIFRRFQVATTNSRQREVTRASAPPPPNRSRVRRRCVSRARSGKSRQKIRLFPKHPLSTLRESLFRRLNRIRPGRHEGVPLYVKTTSTRVRGRQAARAWRNADCGVGEQHTSASCSKTRTRWRRSSRHGLRVRSSHKLASCWGRRNTVERHLYGSWRLTQADLARSDGKCRKCVPAHIFHRLESRPTDLSCRRSVFSCSSSFTPLTNVP